MTPEERRHATFHLDKTRVLEADVFVFVLDGRVPDEGACVELGIAYCQKELQGKKSCSWASTPTPTQPTWVPGSTPWYAFRYSTWRRTRKRC